MEIEVINAASFMNDHSVCHLSLWYNYSIKEDERRCASVSNEEKYGFTRHVSTNSPVCTEAVAKRR
jgi:hypothetical protein